MKVNLKGQEHFSLERDGTQIINLDENLVQYDDEEIAVIPDFSTSGLIQLSSIYTDLSMRDIHGTIANTRETANCYVINSTGYYMLPLVYGNAITGGTNNIQAYTSYKEQYQADFVNYKNNEIISPYIEIDTGTRAKMAILEISDTDNIIENIEIKSDINEVPRFLCFRVINVPDSGANAVLSIKDERNYIMWSWHIWLWKENLTPVTIINYSGNNYDILPVNLGSKYDEDGVHLKNWFYQWGRKDPLLLPAAYNSNTNHASYGNSVFSKKDTAINVSNSINNPCTFYESMSSYKYNWVQLNYFYNYWDATCNATGYTEKTVVKTIYDPCPRGYCVPNARVFTGFTTTGYYTSDSSKFNINGSWANGWNFKTAAGGSVFFPASGYRGMNGDGSLGHIGDNGYYWSAGAYNGGGATRLSFSSNSVNPVGDVYRRDGCSVRPVAI